MKKKLTSIAVAGLLAAPIAANAVPVSFGALSSNDDGSTQVIYDSLNNVEWMRWDVMDTFSYDQTLAAISNGGQFAGQGWRFAYNQQAQMFTNALLQGLPNACTTTGEDTCNSTLPANLSYLLGDTFGTLTEQVSFLTDDGGSENPGYISYTHEGEYGVLYKSNEWGGGYGWLLYRTADGSTPPATSVPEPGTLGLIAAGVAMVGVMRRRRTVA
ncbi:MAG TPA: PEP-CTERM sorting domain-containing protein [Steroidobacteraceae bacterium]|nr:PEP-CTERM sorting domain-containing protein [Steroidobacteraceae bacterium]